MNRTMKCVFSGAMILCAGLGLAIAQEKSEQSTTPPPKVLVVQREFLKPGREGLSHEKTEAAFVQAMQRSKWPEHYVAMNSMSGRPRALFLLGYESFEAFEKDNMAMEKNASLSSDIDRAWVSDGDLLSDRDVSLLFYNDEQSYHSSVDIPHMRYMEISLYRVRPGHRHEWDEALKLVKQGYENIPDAHWAVYEAMYGQEDNTFVVFVPMKSAAEIDQGFAQSKQFRDALGEDGMAKLSQLESSAVEFTQTNLFHFNPKMSYAPDEWVKADPEFWGRKTTMAKKAPAKPSGQP